MASIVQKVMEQVPGADPRPSQRMSAFSGMNDGAATTAARIAGLVQKEQAKDDSPFYTSNFGQVIPNQGGMLNVGGIPVQSDSLLLEKQQAFDRSKIQERIVHPCGSSAFGYFQVNKDVSHLTKAAMFQPGTKTPAYTRFSTVTYGREFPDSGRNPRGFATKFYTPDGNYDLVGLSWPVFFTRDPMMGPDNIRSQQRNPKSFLIDHDAWFDWLSLVPESQHAGMMLMSDHGVPVGWRFMSGYGCHTFKWVNSSGDHVFVKYHWRSQQGIKNFTNEEAMMMCGEDGDFAKRDLFEHIEKGGDARWVLYIQVMKEDEVATIDFDPFDVTKVWPRTQFPMQEVGELVLNRNPEDYHRDVEQAAFSPGSLVPGIELSPDTLLQWRAFFYRDAQYVRLGSANINQIPVNCPFMAKYLSPDNYNGTMRVDANASGKPYYWPNADQSSAPTKDSTPSFDQSTEEKPMQVHSNVLSRKSYWRHEGSPTEYDQVRELYTRVMDDKAREELHKTTAFLLKRARPVVQKNYLIQQCAIAESYAQAIFDRLPEHDGYSMADIKEGAKTAHLVGKSPSMMAKGDKGFGFLGRSVPTGSLAA